MTRIPVIGITLSLFRTKDKSRHSSPVWPAYGRAVAEGGGSPVFLPTFLEPERSAPILDRIDALVLSGGGDIMPENYGARKTTDLDEPDPKRDVFEFSALNWAIEKGIPFLGICRGIQVINVVLGGTLVQDIPSQIQASLAHGRSEAADHPRHVVRLQSGTMLSSLLGAAEIETNSYHHQAILDLAPGLRVSGRAPDGIIEAVELEGFPFGVGVQWHPERMLQEESGRLIFQALTDAANGEGPFAQ